MAPKLLGASNTERLARSGGDKPFKYRRPTHFFEYYGPAWRWAVDLIENRRRLPFKANLEDEKLAILLAAMKQKGVPVRRFETDGEKQDRVERERRLDANPTTFKAKPKSARFEVLDELRDPPMDDRNWRKGHVTVINVSHDVTLPAVTKHLG